MKPSTPTPRSVFWPMSGTYLLGVFNDNFFKEAAILMAFAAGMSELQSPIIKYFSIPFILFSAFAGYFADRFAKRNVVIASKYLELFAMGLGAVGVVTQNFPLIIAMVFLMALQSTLFGPALNGSIPELFKKTDVPRINALLKMITTVSIIIGIVLAGVVLDINIGALAIRPTTILAGVILSVAVLGVVLSHRLTRNTTVQPNTSARFPWRGPVQSVADAISLRHCPKLLKALLGSTFFYFASTMVLAAIHELCLTDLSFSNTFTSALTGIVAIGVATGSLFSIRLSKRFTYEQIFTPAVLAFGIALMSAAAVGISPLAGAKVHLGITLFLSGAFGGLFLIPLLTFIQVTPDAGEKGKVIGINNFLDFSGIFLAGELFGWLHPTFCAASLILWTGIAGIAIAIGFGITSNREKCHA
ncbi:MAG: MFS transporter [Deltaproteobacteria bacterium]|nr:MFS transporter [Deltaproteobacteria bacterium]